MKAALVAMDPAATRARSGLEVSEVRLPPEGAGAEGLGWLTFLFSAYKSGTLSIEGKTIDKLKANFLFKNYVLSHFPCTYTSR